MLELLRVHRPGRVPCMGISRIDIYCLSGCVTTVLGTTNSQITFDQIIIFMSYNSQITD